MFWYFEQDPFLGNIAAAVLAQQGIVQDGQWFSNEWKIYLHGDKKEKQWIKVIDEGNGSEIDPDFTKDDARFIQGHNEPVYSEAIGTTTTTSTIAWIPLQ